MRVMADSPEFLRWEGRRASTTGSGFSTHSLGRLVTLGMLDRATATLFNREENGIVSYKVHWTWLILAYITGPTGKENSKGQKKR